MTISEIARPTPSIISAISKIWVFCPIILQLMSGNTKSGNEKMNWLNVSSYAHRLEPYIHLHPPDVFLTTSKGLSHKKTGVSIYILMGGPSAPQSWVRPSPNVALAPPPLPNAYAAHTLIKQVTLARQTTEPLLRAKHGYFKVLAISFFSAR